MKYILFFALAFFVCLSNTQSCDNGSFTCGDERYCLPSYCTNPDTSIFSCDETIVGCDGVTVFLTPFNPTQPQQPITMNYYDRGFSPESFSRDNLSPSPVEFSPVSPITFSPMSFTSSSSSSSTSDSFFSDSSSNDDNNNDLLETLGFGAYEGLYSSDELSAARSILENGGDTIDRSEMGSVINALNSELSTSIVQYLSPLVVSEYNFAQSSSGGGNNNNDDDNSSSSASTLSVSMFVILFIAIIFA